MNTALRVKTTPFPDNPTTAVEAIDALLAYAVDCGASDIHLDPRTADIIVRLRVDGIMEMAGTLPKRLHDELIARLKILAGARTDIHAVPQDGRWRTELIKDAHNVRASFMPTYYGENAVLRLLPEKPAEHISFARLGFTPDHVRLIASALDATSGLILVTGPTGSGKTTTLSACLSIKAKEPLSVMTLEDPVEYEIAGVRQVHIRHSAGVTFATGLRSALRQDPDVIMVGEIRDAETAHVAVHTALTGHLVLSTLHTNSAIEAIPRLLDMGVDHYLLAATLKLVVAQRLARSICHSCLDGCEKCRWSGYIGRTIVAEVCEVGPDLKDAIARKSSSKDLLEQARLNGFRTMDEDGAEKMAWGVTTEEEIIRVMHA